MMKSSQGHLKKIDSSPTMNLDKMLCPLTGTMACHQKIRQRTYIDSCHWTDHLQKRDFLKPDWWEMVVKRSEVQTSDRWNIHPESPGFQDCWSPFFTKPPGKTGPQIPNATKETTGEASPAQRCHQGRAHQRMTAARPKRPTLHGLSQTNQRVPLLGVSTFKWVKYRSIVSQWYDWYS